MRQIYEVKLNVVFIESIIMNTNKGVAFRKNVKELTFKGTK